MRIVALIILFFLSVQGAWATPPEICSNTLDDDSSLGDAQCDAPDIDADGYFSDGTGPNSGTDCADTNGNIFPGVWADAGGGNVKLCQANGTYTTPVALSAITCNSGSGAVRWFSTAGSNTTGVGSYANPWRDYLCISDTGASCYNAPDPGDCNVFLAGTYTGTFSSADVKQMYIDNRDGTATDKITAMAAPGQLVEFIGQGTSPNEIKPIQLEASDWWIIEGITMRDGYSAAGIYVHSSDNVEVRNTIVYNQDGNAASNNLGGIKCVGSDNFYAHRNLVHDNYQRGANAHNENNAEIYLSRCESYRVEDNIVYSTGSAGFAGIKEKHTVTASAGSNTIKRNVITNIYNGGIEFSSARTTVSGNVLSDVSTQRSGGSIRNYNLGGESVYNGSIIEDNTIINSQFFEYIPDANAVTPALTVRRNIVVDNKGTSYNPDGNEGFIRICHYCTDTVYTAANASVTVDSNGYYNPSVALFFTNYGDTVAGKVLGATYASFALWQAAGQDGLSFSKDPVLSANTNCATASGETTWGARRGCATGSVESGVTVSGTSRGVFGRRSGK